MSQISSLQNPLIKEIHRLDKSRERRKRNLVPVEGLRECRLAVDAGYTVEKILFCSDYIPEIVLQHELNLTPNIDCVDVVSDVFDTLVYRKGTPNALALVVPENKRFEDLKLSTKPLFLVIDSVEKPGNLGAMLRTCDAAAIDAVIVCDLQTDVYNPNCVRASLGAVFTQNVIVTSAEDCIVWLKKNEINTFVTYLDSSESYTLVNFNQPSAIVVGSEADGIKDIWLTSGFKNIIIPQFGKVDSMNVSNSAAILIYEAIRQRNLSPSPSF